MQKKSALSPFLTLEAIAVGLGLGLLLVGGALAYQLTNRYQNVVYPGVSVNGIEVGGLDKNQARAQLAQSLPKPDPSTQLVIEVDGIQVASRAAELGWAYHVDSTIEQAYQVGRRPFPLNLPALWQVNEFTVEPSLNPSQVELMVQALAAQVNIAGKEPQASLRISGNPETIEVFAGEPGRMVVLEPTVSLALSQAQQLTAGTAQVTAPVASTSGTLNETELATAKARAEKLVGSTLTIKDPAFPEATIVFDDRDLVSFLNFPGGIKDESILERVNQVSNRINRPAQNAVFEYGSDLQVTKFEPHRTGLELDSEKLTAQVSAAITRLENDQPVEESALALPLKTTLPEVSLEKTNNLGIKERIGFGDSRYDHSIPNRVHNVTITSERINNTIVAPGQEFSFNQTLGEVSAATGFRSAYVIKNGRTELGDGGGVCQVSSTLFRALLDSGLKITRRLQHSYRVSYYEQNSEPGFDATVYSGNVDLRFINDTDQHILIHSEAYPEDLYMKVEIYGTSDGRTTEITNYRKWDFRGAPAPQYFPDPTLPTGVTRQIDWSASGIKASFTHIVRDKNGNVIRENEYYSNYQPWAAKYLRGI